MTKEFSFKKEYLYYFLTFILSYLFPAGGCVFAVCILVRKKNTAYAKIAVCAAILAMACYVLSVFCGGY